MPAVPSRLELDRALRRTRNCSWRSRCGARLSARARLDHEDRGTRGLARLEVPVRLRGVLERVTLVDLDPYPTCGHVAEDLAGQRVLLDRVGDVVRQCRARDEQRALQRELERVDGRGGTRRGTDEH